MSTVAEPALLGVCPAAEAMRVWAPACPVCELLASTPEGQPQSSFQSRCLHLPVPVEMWCFMGRV